MNLSPLAPNCCVSDPCQQPAHHLHLEPDLDLKPDLKQTAKSLEKERAFEFFVISSAHAQAAPLQ
jgi:hypothetical protein